MGSLRVKALTECVVDTGIPCSGVPRRSGPESGEPAVHIHYCPQREPEENPNEDDCNPKSDVHLSRQPHADPGEESKHGKGETEDDSPETQSLQG